MPRIRTIKPEFWTSEQVVECSPNARLLFVGLWNFCDDGGVHPANVMRAKMEIFPADPFTKDDVQRMIDELIEAGLLVEYEVDGVEYWRVTGWKHQRIDQPTYRHPQPSGAVPCSPNRRRTPAERSQSVRRTDGERSQSVQGVFTPGSGSGSGSGLGSGEEESKPKSKSKPLSSAKKPAPDRGVAKSGPVADKVHEVFDFWRQRLDHPTAKLDGQRDKAVRARLKDGYTVEELKRAVEGITRSAHHMGENDRATVYDDLELICRTASHVDKFIRLADEPPLSGASAAGRQTASAAERWAQAKREEA